jgi:hypothetical protein
MMQQINGNINTTKNFHMFMHPTFCWSKVTFDNKNLIIGVDLLPLANRKTRWYITICHNYYTSDIGKEFMKAMASTILNQDYVQMKNQYKDNALKKAVLFEYTFPEENSILSLKKMFEDYKYPDLEDCVKLYNDYRSTKIYEID